jgi:hypothetical protein
MNWEDPRLDPVPPGHGEEHDDWPDDRPCDEFEADPDGAKTLSGKPACAQCGYSQERHGSG